MRLVSLAAAALVSAALLYASFFGAGPLPALGPAFNPQTGAWTMAADAVSNGSQTLHLAGSRELAQQAPHDLAGPGFRQHLREANVVRPRESADLL